LLELASLRCYDRSLECIPLARMGFTSRARNPLNLEFCWTAA
jgi:hypothetical protein